MRRAAVSFVGAAIVAVAVANGSASHQPAPQAEPASADAIAHGTAVFGRLCASCHGGGGAGGRAPALLDNRRLRAMPEAELQEIVRNGTANGMPGIRLADSDRSA
jgi:mono/diheme cytochrome c family protein